MQPDKADMLGEQDPQEGNSLIDSSHCNYWWIFMKTELHIYYINSGVLGPALVCSLVGGLVPEIPQVSMLVDLVDLPLVFLSPPDLPVLPTLP